MTDPFTIPTECSVCMGDELSLEHYPAESHGAPDAPSREDRYLCEICENSLIVARWAVGLRNSEGTKGILAWERDILWGNHHLLAAIRKASEPARSARWDLP